MSWKPYLDEAWHEFREGLRGPLVPLMFAGLVAYVLLTMVQADYLRQLGAADVPRNSPHFVFMMTSGQSFWLIFAWAWVYAQVVTRDRTASLHEIVLAAPLSLRALIVARFVGATALACLLGASTAFAVLLVPLLGVLGVIPTEAVGPTPLFALLYAFVLFVLPSAIGLGALYVPAALKTRSTTGPFALAAAVILAWMGAMVILQSGDIGSGIATLMDVTGFAETKEQTDHWTPYEKAHSQLALSEPLLLNRILWTLVPLGLCAWSLLRLRRESLVLEREVAARRPQARSEATTHADPLLPAETRPLWMRALFSEARWHLALSVGGWPFRIIMLLWVLINVGGAFVHLTAHAEGPFVPRSQLLAPFLVDLCYVFTVFLIAGFTGTLARRDERTGFGELIDATPAPLGTRVLSRALVAVALSLTFALTPTLSAWVVMALSGTAGFNFWDPLAVNALLAAPSLLELGAIAFLIHALVRSAGTAHALSMVAAFVAIVNHEITVVTYPPAQIGIPVHVALSELTGWAPWLALVLTSDALKVGIVLLAVALAWMTWPRGTDQRVGDRLRAFADRVRGGAGGLAVASAACIGLCAWLLYHQLVVEGEFSSPAAEDAENAAWEARWWNEAAAFSVGGGEVRATIRPSAREARIRWVLKSIRARGSKLHGSLPHGMEVLSARVQGVTRSVTVSHDHFAVDLGECAARGCDVELDLTIADRGWPIEEQPPWLHPSGVWARAENLLPRLGHDPARMLRAPIKRRSLHLPETSWEVDPGALVPALAVAPGAQWRWSVEFSDAGTQIGSDRIIEGPLDFAVIWLPDAPAKLVHNGITVWYGPAHHATAREVLDDVTAMQGCVRARLGFVPQMEMVVQAPRQMGGIVVSGGVLWLPEDEGWDVGSQGVGRAKRRAGIARALAARALAERANLRTEPGAQWLLKGVAGWTGLECVRRVDGAESWMALVSRESEHVVEALGALDSPIAGLAADGAVAWVESYAPLATLGWAEAVGEDEVRRVVVDVTDRVRSGVPLTRALSESAGPQLAGQLLGVPSASDIVVAANASGKLDIRGTRWQWAQGGWDVLDAPAHVVQIFADPGATRRHLGAAPIVVDADTAFTALDAAPAFERSPSDNSWRATAKARPAKVP